VNSDAVIEREPADVFKWIDTLLSEGARGADFSLQALPLANEQP
jgi:hypothetical protein